MSIIKKIGSQVGRIGQSIGNVVEDISDSAKDFAQSVKDSISDEQPTSKKCPGCGEMLDLFATKCNLCGYEFKEIGQSDEVVKLAEDIHKLEEKRNVKAELRASQKANKKVSPTDEKIASLVRNFVVPNNLEAIFEFMVMAYGNLDPYSVEVSASGNPLVVRQAWEAKFEQTYQKAQILFGEQSDFKKIQEIYDKKLKMQKDTDVIGRSKLFRRK